MHPLIKLLTAAILTLVLLSAGCTDTGGSSANSPATETPVHTEVQPTPTREQIENWWDSKPGFEEATVKTLFGDDLYGIKNEAYGGASYNIFNIDTGDCILKHSDCPNFDPYDNLQPEQARALEDRYGSVKSVVMEQADTDGDGALDKVAVKYEGSKGVGEFTTDYDGFDGIGHYLSLGIYYNLFE